MADCEHEWEPLEFKDGEKSKASVCLECGALKSGQGTMVITADYIDFSPLTANPTLAEGRQWFRSDFDAMYWSPDGSVIERIQTTRPGVSGSLTGIKGFEYLIEGAATDSWEFTMNPSAGVWIKQYSTAASFNAQMVYHGAYQHWTADNTAVDVPNKAENVYGAGEEVVAHMMPDGTLLSKPAVWGNIHGGPAWDGQYFWFGEISAGVGVADRVYRVDTGFNPVYHFSTPRSDGVTWDGSYVWSANQNSGFIYQYDKTGGNVSTISGGSPSPSGLAWDGEYLWHAALGTAYHIYQLTPGGTVKGSFATPAALNSTNVKGVAWDGTYLHVSAWKKPWIYRFRPDGTQVGYFSLGEDQAGLGWDGTYLWGCALSTVYQYGNAGSFDLDYRIQPA